MDLQAEVGVEQGNGHTHIYDFSLFVHQDEYSLGMMHVDLEDQLCNQYWFDIWMPKTKWW